MASNIAQQRIQREFREVVKSEEVAKSGVQVIRIVIAKVIISGLLSHGLDRPIID